MEITGVKKLSKIDGNFRKQTLKFKKAVDKVLNATDFTAWDGCIVGPKDVIDAKALAESLSGFSAFMKCISYGISEQAREVNDKIN